MKRFFFSLIALSAAAIGCTQSAVLDSPDLQGTEISFSPYTGRTPLTKAQSIEGPGGVQDVHGLAEDGGFNVISFLNKPDGSASVFMDGQVKYNGTSWLYGEFYTIGEEEWQWQATTKYWPDSQSDYTLSFAAYSSNVYGPEGVPDNFKKNPQDDLIVWTEANKSFTYNVPTKVKEQVDLLAADYQSNLKANNNGGKVTLDFNHLLSRVGFKLISTTDDKSIDVVIKSVKLVGKFPVSGNVDLLSESPTIESIDNTSAPLETEYELMDFTGDNGADGAFIVKNTTTPLPIYATHVIPSEVKKDSEFQALGVADSTANAQSRYMMIIPHEVTDNTADRIVVSYQLTDAIQRTATIPLTNMGLKFEPCKAYEFYLSVSTKSIGFRVEEHFWGENVESDPKPLTPAETAIKITGAEETVKGKKATVKAHVKNEQYESIVIQSFSDDGKWTDVTDPQYVEDETDYIFEGIDIEPNRAYSFRVAAKLVVEETPDSEVGEDEEEQREMVYSATYIFNTAPAVVTSLDENGQSAAVIDFNEDELSGVYVTLFGEFPATNGDLELEKLGFRCSLDDETAAEGYLLGALWDVTVSTTGIDRGDSFEYGNLFAPNTTYYYQSTAKNAKVKEITYGNVTSFTTPVITPIVTTGGYDTNTVTENTVDVTAVLNSHGGDNENIEVGFHLSTDEGFTADNTLTFDYPTATIGSGDSFTVTASGLTANTIYHYRAFANNTAEAPYDSDVTGSPAELVTKAVATTTIVDYTDRTVVLTIPNGGVGNATLEQGFYISTDEDDLKAAEAKKSFPKDTKDNCSISGLDAGVNYFVQAYVTNGAGTVYGKVVSFTTTAGDESIPDWDDDEDAEEIV